MPKAKRQTTLNAVGEEDSHSFESQDVDETKAAHTRTKNRIAKGVCPCCSRTFLDLQRHMQTKHPDFTKQEN